MTGAAGISGAVADRIVLWEELTCRASPKGQEASTADEHTETGHRPNLSTSSDSSAHSEDPSGPHQWKSPAARHGLLLDAQELRGIELIAGARAEPAIMAPEVVSTINL